VDAFGSPTVQNDLTVFDSTFALHAALFTILCPTEDALIRPQQHVPRRNRLAIETSLDVEMLTQWHREQTLC